MKFNGIALPSLVIHAFTFARPVFAVEKRIDVASPGFCISISLEQGESETLSCSLPADVSYRVLDCKTREVIERGTNQAHLSCPDASHWELAFKTSKGIARASVSAKRENKGKKGVFVSYVVDESSFVPSATDLPDPEIIFDSKKKK